MTKLDVISCLSSWAYLLISIFLPSLQAFAKPAALPNCLVPASLNPPLLGSFQGKVAKVFRNCIANRAVITTSIGCRGYQNIV